MPTPFPHQFGGYWPKGARLQAGARPRHAAIEQAVGDDGTQGAGRLPAGLWSRNRCWDPDHDPGLSNAASGRAAIDSSYKFFCPSWWKPSERSWVNEILWLYGDSGCGKSGTAQKLSRPTSSSPFTRLNMDGHLTRGDIIGVQPHGAAPTARPGQCTLRGRHLAARCAGAPGLRSPMGVRRRPEARRCSTPVLEGEPLRILEDHGRVVTAPAVSHRGHRQHHRPGIIDQRIVNAAAQNRQHHRRLITATKMPYLITDMEKRC